MMIKTGMLVVTNPNKFLRFVPRIQKEVGKTLYIQVLPDNRLKYKSSMVIASKRFSGPNFSSAVTRLYSDSVSLKCLDVRILLSTLKDPSIYKIPTKKTVEIVYFDQCLNIEEMIGFLERVENRTDNCLVVSLGDDGNRNNEPDVQLDTDSDIYEQVVLGGTFDRLHNGHKTLLSEAALRSCKTVTVGVTNTEMLKSKKLWELIEPCEERMEKVKDFLEDVNPGLEYCVVPIADMYGPTKDNPNFQLLVVSNETLKGGDKVNEVRASNHLNSLVVKSVDLLPDTKLDDVEEDKISSSNDRLRLLGTRLKPPKEPEGLPKWPYIIGLTGGICSGKTSIARRLEKLGAGVINSDDVGHLMYSSGQPGHSAVVNKFGTGILASNGEIDRKKLADIVFNNKGKLQELNELMWPIIHEKVMEMATDLYEKEGHKVVFIEAALLLDAGWQTKCHQVWSCILPKDEAATRLMARNNLSKEEAEKRIGSQLSNTDFVKSANVVLSSFWSNDYTQKQVLRAWNQLQHFLNER